MRTAFFVFVTWVALIFMCVSAIFNDWLVFIVMLCIGVVACIGLATGGKR